MDCFVCNNPLKESDPTFFDGKDTIHLCCADALTCTVMSLNRSNRSDVHQLLEGLLRASRYLMFENDIWSLVKEEVAP